MSQRRSTRLEKAAVAGGSASKDYEQESDSEERQFEEWAMKKAPAGKKRKAVEDSDTAKVANPRPAKKARGKRGLLKNVVEMPMDVIFEIFGRLTPLDLWHLAQTSNELRRILMSRSSVSVWKEARLNYPGLPDCPNDLSEPQYAVLLFAKHCFECMRNVAISHTFWDARVRLCLKCVEMQCSSADQSYRVNSSLRQWIPQLTIHKKTGRSPRLIQYFYRPLVLKWEKKSKKLAAEDKKLAAWVQKTRKERKIIFEHGRACLAWFRTFQETVGVQRASLIDQRRLLVVEHAKKLGWTEELVNIPSSLEKLQQSSLITKACQKDLTERTLTNLGVHINELMTTVRATRIDNELKSLLKNRLPILENTRDEHVKTLPPNTICPSAGQLSRIPMVRNIIINTPTTAVFTKDHLQPVIEAFTELTSQWKEDLKHKFLKMIKDAHGPHYAFDEDTIFDLATTFFSCRACHSPTSSPHKLVRYPRVLIHSCLRARYHGHTHDLDIHDQVVYDVINEGPWKNGGQVTFNLDHVKFLGDVLELAGFDRHTATAKEVDDANPIFECLTCHSCYKGRLTMSWATLMFHRQDYHFTGGKPMVLKLLEEKEASFVMQQLIIQQEKEYANAKALRCTICHDVGSSVSLKRHIKEIHRRVATAEDIVPLLDYNHTFPMYHLWPPREEGEHELVTGTEMALAYSI